MKLVRRSHHWFHNGTARLSACLALFEVSRCDVDSMASITAAEEDIVVSAVHATLPRFIDGVFSKTDIFKGAILLDRLTLVTLLF